MAPLAVRGAPAIGITGAYGLIIGLDEAEPTTTAEALAALERLDASIAAVRPTAVNLSAALTRVRAAAEGANASSPEEVRSSALNEAVAIHNEDRAASTAIAEQGRAAAAK